MQTNLLWTGREYHSIENCLVTTDKKGSVINSTIVGYYEQKIYQVDYSIRTNENWETISFDIRSRHSNKAELIRFERDGKGTWTSEGAVMEKFEGCIEIDIPLTPFTNTLPINRLRLKRGAMEDIDVIYIDLLEGEIRRVKQRYLRLSDKEYQYQNIPNDFEAVIQVDASGFVLDYPSLFVRTASLETRYE